MRFFPRTISCGREGPLCIDLFAGAGGLAAGFRQAGFWIASGSDQDKDAGTTFRRNFPEASFFLGDVAKLRGPALLRDARIEAGELHCLIGGPPCQAFSYNNHQRSVENVRAGLFRQYLRIVRALRPATLVMENVPGILTIGNGSIMSEIFSSLERLGYEAKAKILYAEDFGSPQQRRRVFFVGTRLGWSDELFPDGVCVPATKPASNEFIHRWTPQDEEDLLPAPSVWDAIGDLPTLNGPTSATRYRRDPNTWLQEFLRAGQSAVTNHEPPKLGETMLNRIRHVPPGGSWRDIPHRLLPSGMQRARRSDHTRRYGRLHRNGLCSTILTKCDPHWGSFIHPTADRVITVREAARIQTFQDDFLFLGNRSAQYAQVGNAVPPLLAAAIGRTILRHLQDRGF